MSMRKYASKEHAKDDAEENGLCYGWSVFAPMWFVGTFQQLKEIGVIKPIGPSI